MSDQRKTADTVYDIHEQKKTEMVGFGIHKQELDLVPKPKCMVYI